MEKAKIQLSATPTASIFATEDEVRAKDLGGEEIYISIDLSRQEMENLIRDQVEDTIRLCRKIISDNGYTSEFKYNSTDYLIIKEEDILATI